MDNDIVTTYEVEELAAHICGLNYDEVDVSEIDDALMDKFEISFDRFHELIRILLPMIDVGKSPLTKKKYKGFSKVEGDAALWLVKILV